MNFINYSKNDIFNTKIQIEMTVAEFLNLYVSIMNVNPQDFKSYVDENFPNIDEEIRENLFTKVHSEEMEEIIDKLKIPHIIDWCK